MQQAIGREREPNIDQAAADELWRQQKYDEAVATGRRLIGNLGFTAAAQDQFRTQDFGHQIAEQSRLPGSSLTAADVRTVREELVRAGHYGAALAAGDRLQAGATGDASPSKLAESFKTELSFLGHWQPADAEQAAAVCQSLTFAYTGLRFDTAGHNPKQADIDANNKLLGTINTLAVKSQTLNTGNHDSFAKKVLADPVSQTGGQGESFDRLLEVAAAIGVEKIMLGPATKPIPDRSVTAQAGASQSERGSDRHSPAAKPALNGRLVIAGIVLAVTSGTAIASPAVAAGRLASARPNRESTTSFISSEGKISRQIDLSTPAIVAKPTEADPGQTAPVNSQPIATAVTSTATPEAAKAATTVQITAEGRIIAPSTTFETQPAPTQVAQPIAEAKLPAPTAAPITTQPVTETSPTTPDLQTAPTATVAAETAPTVPPITTANYVLSQAANLQTKLADTAPQDPTTFNQALQLAQKLAQNPTLPTDDPAIKNLILRVGGSADANPVPATNQANRFAEALAETSDAANYPVDHQKLMQWALGVAAIQLQPGTLSASQAAQQSGEFVAAAATTAPVLATKPSPGVHHESHHLNLHTKSYAHEHLVPSKYNTGNFHKVFEFFANDKDLNISPVGAASLTANFAEETAGTMDPTIIQGGAHNINLPAAILNILGYGLNQATSKDRQLHLAAVAARMHKPAGSLDVQLQFIKEELMKYPELMHLLRQNNSKLLHKMTYRVEHEYERAGLPAISIREHYAHLIYRANVPLRRLEHTGRNNRHHARVHEQHDGKLFNTSGELPQAHQVVKRAKHFAHMSPAALTAVCGTNPGEECYRMCAHLAARAWGRENAGYGTAAVQWDAMKASGEAHVGSRNVPVGAELFYSTGQLEGHVAVYLGNGKVLTNDVKDTYTGEGGAYIVNADDLEGSDWKLIYEGWAPPVYSTPHVSSWHYGAPRSHSHGGQGTIQPTSGTTAPVVPPTVTVTPPPSGYQGGPSLPVAHPIPPIETSPIPVTSNGGDTITTPSQTGDQTGANPDGTTTQLINSDGTIVNQP